MAVLRDSLIIFIKAPEPGRVKTRLGPDLSPEEAERLYRAFIDDTLEAASRLKHTNRIIGCHPSRNDPFFESLKRKHGVELIDQKGGDLGQRMRNAFFEIQSCGGGPVVLVGTDSPTLPPKMIRKAFDFLKDHDLVIGPAQDGGYYLIGCRPPVPPVFDGIPWGTDRVLELTLRKAADSKVRCALLPFWYDVDTIRDLRFLAAHLEHLESMGKPSLAPRTQEMIKRLRL